MNHNDPYLALALLPPRPTTSRAIPFRATPALASPPRPKETMKRVVEDYGPVMGSVFVHGGFKAYIERATFVPWVKKVTSPAYWQEKEQKIEQKGATGETTTKPSRPEATAPVHSDAEDNDHERPRHSVQDTASNGDVGTTEPVDDPITPDSIDITDSEVPSKCEPVTSTSVERITVRPDPITSITTVYESSTATETPTSTPCHFSLPEIVPDLSDWRLQHALGVLLFLVGIPLLLWYFFGWFRRQAYSDAAPGDDDDANAPFPGRRARTRPTSTQRVVANGVLVDQVVAAGRRHLPEIMRRRPTAHTEGPNAVPNPREGFEATMRGLVDVVMPDQRTPAPVPQYRTTARARFGLVWPSDYRQLQEAYTTLENRNRDTETRNTALQLQIQELRDSSSDSSPASNAGGEQDSQSALARFEAPSSQGETERTPGGGSFGPQFPVEGDPSYAASNADHPPYKSPLMLNHSQKAPLPVEGNPGLVETHPVEFSDSMKSKETVPLEKVYPTLVGPTQLPAESKKRGKKANIGAPPQAQTAATGAPAQSGSKLPTGEQPTTQPEDSESSAPQRGSAPEADNGKGKGPATDSGGDTRTTESEGDRIRQRDIFKKQNDLAMDKYASD